MRGIKPTLVTIVAIGLLTGSAVGVAAQDEEPDAGPVAYTTGTSTQPAEVVAPTEEDRPGGSQMRGLVLIDIPVEFTDSRLSGLMTISANGEGQEYADGFATLESRTYRIVNEDGAWAGSGDYILAIVEGAPPLIAQESVVLTGEGDYEGFVAYLLMDIANQEPELEAVILDIERAPLPEPVSVE